MNRNILSVIAAGVLLPVSVALYAQGGIPNFKAPPGQKVTVTKTTVDMDFDGYPIEIPLPINLVDFNPAVLPAGTKVDTVAQKPSKVVAALIKDPSSLLPGHAAPSKVRVFGVRGKEGTGTIVYLYYDKKLPINGRQLVSNYLYKDGEKPEPEKSDEALVTEDYVIVWSFNDPFGPIKNAHQEKIMKALSENASVWAAANPAKSDSLTKARKQETDAKAAKQKKSK